MKAENKSEKHIRQKFLRVEKVVQVKTHIIFTRSQALQLPTPYKSWISRLQKMGTHQWGVFAHLAKTLI